MLLRQRRWWSRLVDRFVRLLTDFFSITYIFVFGSLNYGWLQCWAAFRSRNIIVLSHRTNTTMMMMNFFIHQTSNQSFLITMIFVFGRINYGWLQRSAVIDCNVSTRFLPATIFVSCQLMVFFWTFSWFSMKNKHTATKITNYTTTNSGPFMSKIQQSTITAAILMPHINQRWKRQLVRSGAPVII